MSLQKNYMRKWKRQGKTENRGASTWHGYQNLKNQKKKAGKRPRAGTGTGCDQHAKR